MSNADRKLERMCYKLAIQQGMQAYKRNLRGTILYADGNVHQCKSFEEYVRCVKYEYKAGRILSIDIIISADTYVE